uniref:Chaperone SurA n=1 Tax=Candidatus Kentrum sp. LFY TaxID=2126342 RepID=A0A450V356_9GAMM|nr:MAG: periplasmic chaperone for outer membrane proteins SurA [Candidatus Kentron sp. LFY]
MKHNPIPVFIPIANILISRWLPFVLLFLFLPVTVQSAPTPITDLNRIVAVVNDEVIVLSDLKNRMRTMRAELLRSGTKLPPAAVLKKRVLDRLIVELVQVQAARRIGIQIDDERATRAITNIARRNGLKLHQFRKILERDGYKFAIFRRDMERRLLIAEVQRRQVANRIQVTAREIDNYLATHASKPKPKEDYHLAHILITVPKSANPDEIAATHEKAKRIVARLRGGANFAKMAKTASDGQQASKGGDIGWRKKTQLPSLFKDIVIKMESGEISDPLRSASGFHIVKIIATRGKQEGRHVISQTNARHILIKTNELTSNTDAKTRLEQIRERITQGEDFEELARSHSEDRGTAVKGGNIGWISPGNVVPKFEQAMNKLRPMKISAPFRTQFGWHIVQVLGRRNHDGTEDVRRTKAMEKIRERKLKEEIDTWLRQLRDEAYVEYRLEEE